MKRKLFIRLNLILILIFVLTAGLSCKTPNREVQEHLQPITLKYWRVWDDADAFDEIIAAYRQIRPHVKIEYRKFRYEEYEQALLEALAEDRGPDIFSIHESWLRKYQTRILPMPAEIKMAQRTVKGTIKPEVITELKTIKTLTLREIRDNFADIVYENVVIDGKVYGLPLGLETLIMFYNKDILNRSGVAQPPNTWQDFQTAVQKITRFDNQNNLTQSGAALGTGFNVERSFDLISILMMQNGAVMANPQGLATFLQETERRYNPGLEAIKFYTDFASPVKSVYTWNSAQSYSFDAFIAGRVGFVFGYNYHLPLIRSRAPRLNLGLAALPQVNPNNPINYASYWVETVSRKSANQNAAWDFIIFATNQNQVKSYLDKTRKPTALKALINSQMDDDDLYLAAGQILTAKNWYRGLDPLAAEEAMKEMIENFLKKTSDREGEAILNTGLQKINQTIK